MARQTSSTAGTAERATAIRNRVKELRHVRAGDLVPNPKNWRTHPQDQQDALRGVLAEIGYADALIARKVRGGKLMLSDGHLRAEVTPDMEVPVLVTDLTEAEADKLLATLDPLAAMAEADAGKLAELLGGIDTESDALRAMMDELAKSAPLPTPDVVEDEVPKPPANPITKPGDLWLLGDHRLLCGDSTKADDVARVMGGKKADCAIFDPPWDAGIVIEIPRPCLVFGDGGSLGNVIKIFGEPTWLFSWDCVTSWYTPNRPLRRQKIAVWYGKIDSYKFDGSHYGEAGESHVVSNTRGTYEYKADVRGKHLSDVFVRQITVEHAIVEHPHAKPLDWMRMLIGNCTDGLIYDPFLGSGTSIIAAEQLNRRCFGIEISPAYCDVIVKRWENMTGKKANREGRKHG